MAYDSRERTNGNGLLLLGRGRLVAAESVSWRRSIFRAHSPYGEVYLMMINVITIVDFLANVKL